MKTIQLNHISGPHGDETSTYSCGFPTDITVADFIITAVKENPKEWGSIHIGVFGPKLADYSSGRITYTDKYESVAHKIVLKATANGGWSLMSYYLEIEG